MQPSEAFHKKNKKITEKKQKNKTQSRKPRENRLASLQGPKSAGLHAAAAAAAAVVAVAVAAAPVRRSKANEHIFLWESSAQ